jgi:predicted nucleic acid-binding protein
MVYLDTSVLAAYYCPEAMSAKAEKAILRSVLPAISLLVEVEFYAAVARKMREGALSEADATRIVTRFRLHIDEGCYERLPIDATHFEVARDWVGRFATPLRTLDALHLAVCFASDAVLLTADVGLAKAAHHFRVPTKLLGQAEA